MQETTSPTNLASTRTRLQTPQVPWPEFLASEVTNIDPSIESPKKKNTSQEEIAIGYECYSLQLHNYEAL